VAAEFSWAILTIYNVRFTNSYCTITTFMKQFLLLFCLFALAATGYAQDVYVDADASDGGDGTTWATAYNDLSVALNTATPGSNVWVAEGTYVTPDSSSFVIDEELSLYGGFAGTETMVSEADPENNPTILSGDVMGNDPADMSYDSTLMDENNRVLLVTDTTAAGNTYTVTIDGFTITNGVIATDAPSFSTAFFGGGMLATATVNVSRVRFTRNRASYGSATGLVFGSASGSTFTDIVSEGNYDGGSSMHYSNSVDTISYVNSRFTGVDTDTITSGMIRPVFVNGFTVDNCTFEDVTAATGRGAGIYATNILGGRIMNSTFTNLHSDAGGALYLRNNDLYEGDREVDANEMIIDNCTFSEIQSQRWGGTIAFYNISHSVLNSTFDGGIGNQSGGLGGCVYAANLDTLTYAYRIDSTEFINNLSITNNGGAVYYFSDNISIDIANSTFTGNSGGFGGAMLISGSVGDDSTMTTVNNCTFTDNQSLATGGAIYIQDEAFTISDTEFTGNLGSAGTIGMFGAVETHRISNCNFLNNGSSDNAYNLGSGIFTRLNGGEERSDSLFIDNCTFTGNLSTRDPGFVSGGTIYVRRGNRGSAGMPFVGITNSSFTNNSALEDAQGGAIYAQDGSMVSIMDSEFLNNNAGGGGGAFFARQFTETIEVIDTIENDTMEMVVPYANNIPTYDIHRSLFIANIAGSQGGVADLQSGQMNMTNSIAVNNAVTQGAGSGGAVIINGTNGYAFQSENIFVNNTFYGNTDGGRAGTDSLLGASGNAIALYQEIGMDSAANNSVTLTIQNNAFFQTDAAEEALGIEQTGMDGTIIVNSLGGNYFNSSAQPGFVINDLDGSENITNLDIVDDEIFLDPFLDDPLSDFPNLDLIRGDGNPLIDGGTTGPLVPEVDYFGEERDSIPDIGAIEYDGVRVDVAEPIAESGLDMEFFPNPTVDVVNIVNHDASITEFTVLVSDAQGRFLTARTFGAGKNVLDIARLPMGSYNLSLLINGKVYSQQIVKR
jgi:predicted outer membrane repeat protein